eukprot:comp25217_c0_seq1/m.46972 comp25217_c0_seq1/g.46972  ORF comp25217_c0_seq1/g.46972 comp25217_c0_seq1/m.46972 type:complete len:218 (-) comp25217_c0_seq1:254-907(-)
MKSVAILATAAGLAAATANGPQLEVCAAIDPACASPLLCAPVIANGDCTNLPIPETLAPVVAGFGISALYTKATVGGADIVDAQLFKDATCSTPLAQQFKLTPNACTQIPDQIIYVVAKDDLAGATPVAPSEAAAGNAAVAATTTAAAGTEHATMHATTTAAATTTAHETMAAVETAPATQAATRRNARLVDQEAAASNVVPTAFALCAAVVAALLN